MKLCRSTKVIIMQNLTKCHPHCLRDEADVAVVATAGQKNSCLYTKSISHTVEKYLSLH